MGYMKFTLVLACMSPLFILLAIRGISTVPFEYYFPILMGMAFVPNIYLALRLKQAKRLNDRKIVRVFGATDNKEHLLTYIFAMLIPLYQASLGSTNDLLSAVCALLFIVFIFGHMELYYMNIWFAFFDYRILSIRPETAMDGFSVPHVLITKRDHLPEGIEIQPLRITDFLLFDNN